MNIAPWVSAAVQSADIHGDLFFVRLKLTSRGFRRTWLGIKGVVVGQPGGTAVALHIHRRSLSDGTRRVEAARKPAFRLRRMARIIWAILRGRTRTEPHRHRHGCNSRSLG